MKHLPTSAISLLIIALGAGVLYGLGRWDQSIDSQLRAHNEQVDRQLGQFKKLYSRFQDSVTALEVGHQQHADSLHDVATGARRQLAGVRDSLAVLALSAQSDSIESVLADLPFMVQIDRNTFQTDSLGLRNIAALNIMAIGYEKEVPLLEQEVEAQRLELLDWKELYRLANVRADSAHARTLSLEADLATGRRLSQCRIIGFIPCPSRGVMLVVGLGLGAAVTVVIAR